MNKYPDYEVPDESELAILKECLKRIVERYGLPKGGYTCTNSEKGRSLGFKVDGKLGGWFMVREICELPWKWTSIDNDFINKREGLEEPGEPIRE